MALRSANDRKKISFVSDLKYKGQDLTIVFNVMLSEIYFKNSAIIC